MLKKSHYLNNILKSISLFLVGFILFSCNKIQNNEINNSNNNNTNNKYKYILKDILSTNGTFYERIMNSNIFQLNSLKIIKQEKKYL